MDRDRYRKYLLLIQCHHASRHGDDRVKGVRAERYRGVSRYVIDDQTSSPICMDCRSVIGLESDYTFDRTATLYEARCFHYSSVGFADVFNGDEKYGDSFNRLWLYNQNKSDRQSAKEMTYGGWLDVIAPSEKELFGIEWEVWDELTGGK